MTIRLTKQEADDIWKALSIARSHLRDYDLESESDAEYENGEWSLELEDRLLDLESRFRNISESK